MKRFHICIALPVVAFALFLVSCSQEQEVQRDIVVEPDGSIVINHAVVPLPELLSEEGRQVLMRTDSTEGPGAPVPLPGDIPILSSCAAFTMRIFSRMSST